MTLDPIKTLAMMRTIAKAAVLTLACLSIAHAAAAIDTDEPFDRPLQTQRVSLGPSPYSPGQNAEVRCYTYPGFMVKEVDRIEVGDDQISVLPLRSPADQPRCRAANQPHEKLVPNDSWSGYFLGVKANYVFVSAADGTNQGMSVAVFRHDNAAHLLFQDLMKLDHDRIQLRSISDDGAHLQLHYTRLYVAPCSVQTDGASCWTRIVADTHLPATPLPDCAAGYLRARQELAAGRCEAQSHPGDATCLAHEMQLLADDDKTPSVIGYDVNVVLQPSGPQMTTTNAAGSCWPAD
jgi:hypothetical protein